MVTFSKKIEKIEIFQITQLNWFYSILSPHLCKPNVCPKASEALKINSRDATKALKIFWIMVISFISKWVNGVILVSFLKKSQSMSFAKFPMKAITVNPQKILWLSFPTLVVSVRLSLDSSCIIWKLSKSLINQNKALNQRIKKVASNWKFVM